MKRITTLLITFLIGANILAQKSDDIQLANEYFIKGEFEKASDLYKSLATKPQNISNIHNNYFSLLLELKDYKTADKYLKRINKLFPQNVYYQIDQGILLGNIGKEQDAEKVFDALINKYRSNEYSIRLASQYFITKRYYEFALKSLLASRSESKVDDKHAL